MKKEWQVLVPDKTRIHHLSHSLNCHPLIAALLVNRGIVSKTEAMRFLNPSLKQLRPPFSIKDMDRAVDRIASAISRKEKIMIFGDYDVDGITATVIYYEFLRGAGADVIYYIPHRIKEGYGLQEHHVTQVAKPSDIKLIITADCGISSCDAVVVANRTGIDVIVTDHHHVPESLPPAVAVVNPKRRDCTAGFEHLAGVGVAFNLLICLRKHLRKMRFWPDRREPNLKHFCDLVALGTIADQVPLLYENRILTKIGLEQIKSGNRTGIMALIKASGKREIFDAEDVAFRLAPRMNAPGRMAHAKMAVDLLMSNDVDSAMSIAEYLNNMNSERQRLEKKIIEEIEDMLDNHPEHIQKNTLVLSSATWHEGILGIVASRLTEKLFRPVVLFATKDGMGKGSARSVPGIDIFQAIKSCARNLETFGGHSMAAGLRVAEEKIESFEKDLEAFVEKNSYNETHRPAMKIDCELKFSQISPALLDALEALGPFGQGNPEPLFVSRNIRVRSHRIVGENHCQMILQQLSDGTPRSFQAIQFNIAPGTVITDGFEHIAFRLRWNHWNGNKTIQLVIEDT
ncbi:MAG: single-stranded-DNA-specific exonuclease RecJ [Deltaproteobacteria bacterium]|nr:single-stranded-DNA-specific exonuclease RecJ [Deltaproteobacteria bacterium]